MSEFTLVQAFILLGEVIFSILVVYSIKTSAKENQKKTSAKLRHKTESQKRARTFHYMLSLNIVVKKLKSEAKLHANTSSPGVY